MAETVLFQDDFDDMIGASSPVASARSAMLATVRPYVEAGFAIHWLKAKSKAPAGGEGWSSAPTATFADLAASWFTDANVGVRLGSASRVAGGYLYVIDLDIRIDDKGGDALARLAELFPNFMDLPVVISGSGGASRHLYFISDKVFGGRKLARSDGFKMVFDPAKNREVKKRDWEIELFGTGKQVVMPPSIHPDTGQPYRWHKPFDLDLVECGIVPFVPSARLESLLGAADGDCDADAKPTLGMSIDDAKVILDDLPVDEWCEDRDGWYRVGMALHHEFGGSDEAAALWEAFSRQSAKFDAKNQRQVWRSIKGKSNPVRMATLLQAAKHARMMRGFDDDADSFDQAEPAPSGDAADDFDALLGGGEDEPTGMEWMRLLDLNEEGAIKATLHNLKLIVANDVRTAKLPMLNDFTHEIVQREAPRPKAQRARAAKPTPQLAGKVWQVEDRQNGDLWSDDRDFAVRSIIEAPKTQGGYSIKVSDRDLRAAISMVAQENWFHPVREYLEKQSWDGKERLDTLFVRYLGAPDNAYSRSVARLMLVAGVTRIYEPGHKFDYALILEGLQGKRKSTFIEVLGCAWFAELDGDFHDTKQMVELMQGAWILEIPELTGFSRSDVRAIKAFISRRVDKVRLAYARRAGEFPRQCIFIGSTNDKEYLRDDTGGRRFWPMPCETGEIDTDGLRREIDQVWAEAVVRYRELRSRQPHGTLPLYLTDADAQREAAQLQESRRVESADNGIAGQIGAWLDTPVPRADFDSTAAPRRRDATCLTELWVRCLGNDIKTYNQASAQMLGRAMRLVPGWTTTGSLGNIDGFGRQRVYTRD